jgi:hypothetical protein
MPVSVAKIRSETALPLTVALLAGLFVWNYYARYAPGLWSDFDMIWLGARAVLAGRDPYVEVPARGFPWPLYYPVPALILGMPFAPLPLMAARIAFAAVTAFAFTAALVRRRPQALPLLFSGPFIYAIQRGQWSPLLVAGALIPALGGVIAAKPSIGLATLAYRPHRAAIAGAAALTVLSLLLLPSWPWTWRDILASAQHLVAPVMLPGGVILLLALLKWRQPEARLLAVLACVPQTSAVYELLPLSLVPRTRREAFILANLWNVVYLARTVLRSSGPLTFAQLPEHRNPWLGAFVIAVGYVPVLVMVLRHRDDEMRSP